LLNDDGWISHQHCRAFARCPKKVRRHIKILSLSGTGFTVQLPRWLAPFLATGR